MTVWHIVLSLLEQQAADFFVLNRTFINCAYIKRLIITLHTFINHYNKCTVHDLEVDQKLTKEEVF